MKAEVGGGGEDGNEATVNGQRTLISKSLSCSLKTGKVAL